MSILDQIANPQMADIVGALNVREQRIARDEEKRKEIRMGKLISEALPNIREGSPLHRMATEMPREFAAFTKAIGVPLNDGERMQQFADDTEMLYTLAQDDPRAAMQYALDTAEDRKEAGQNTAQLDRFIEGMRDDPQRTMTGLFLMQRSLSSKSKDKPAGLAEFEGMTEGFSEEDKMKAKRIAAGLDPRAVGSGTITTAVTPGLTQAVAGSEAEITGAKAEATNQATAKSEAKKSINRSNQLIGNIKLARSLIPAATGSLAGAARDKALGALGVSTDESKAAAQLETLAGWMVANVPRMEGPQSNIDVENYRIMAGRVGDRTVPTSERLAALDVLENLQSKYADLNREIVGQGGSGEGAMTTGITQDAKELSLDELLGKY